MAWPVDARYQTFAAGSPVASAFLNDLQDQIIEAFSERVFMVAPSHVDSSGTDWLYDNTDGTWECKQTGILLHYSIPTIIGGELTKVRLKYYVAAATGIQWSLDRGNPNYAAPATAPTRTYIGGFTTSGGSPPYWGVWDSGTLSYDMGDGNDFQLAVDSPDINDKLCSLEVTVKPWTSP